MHRTMPQATPATSHMFIVNPFAGSGTWLLSLFSTHPPTDARVLITGENGTGKTTLLNMLGGVDRPTSGEILFHDKNLLLLHHQGHYQLLLRNTVVYNPWLSSEAAFIQRFSQPYSVRLQGLKGRWRVKQHLFDQHHGALFPLVDAFRSRSGPDAEDYQWLMHQARPALSVEEARLDGHWLRVDSLESNALALYEFTPQLSPGEDPDA